MFHSPLLKVVLLICCSAPAQQATTDPGDRPLRDRRREERRQRERAATPEARRERMLDRWVDWAGRLYDLSENQRDLARQEFAGVMDERRRAMGADAQRLEELRARLGETWRQRTEAFRASGEDRPRWRDFRDDAKIRELREEIDKIQEKHPFDRNLIFQRLESLLPPDQAAMGRDRLRELNDRRGERRDRREARRDRFDRDGRRDGRGPEARRGSDRGDGSRPPAAAQHPWDQYVRRFIRQHNLTESQANSARAILRELQDRAVQLEKSAEAAAEARKQVELSNQSMFDELKQRLDGLLTAEQRGAGR